MSLFTLSREARIFRRLSLVFTLLATVGAVSSAQADNIAVFGNNNIGTFLTNSGHTVTQVTDGDLATEGYLDSFDIFVYTRDGSSFLPPPMSEASAANVTAFVTGNIALFTSDLQDNNFPGDATNTLMLNAVSWVGAKGFIGEYSGSCAAMSANNQGISPLGIIDGDCTNLQGAGGDPMDILQNDHPIVAGVPDPVNLGGSHEFFTLIATDPDLVIAENSAQNPSIIAADGSGVGAVSRATFAVNKIFSDDSNGDVDVTLTCNTGLPLQQSFTITGGDPVGVTFVVNSFEEGTPNCTVTEDPVPDNYTASYDDGTVSDVNCSYDAVTSQAYTCTITNTADPAEFTVTKEWIVSEEGGGDEIDQMTDIIVWCDKPIIDGEYGDESDVPTDDPIYGWGAEIVGDGFVTVLVDTSTGPAKCTATEGVLNELGGNAESGIEVTTDCPAAFTDDGFLNLTDPSTWISVEAGSSEGCGFTNTVFFEGIPSLNQYGLAIMALLMLGLGMVGFRRFA